MTRDFVKQLAEETRCRVYVVYIYVTGNTHPLNNAAAHCVMQWHKAHYGFEPVYLASEKNFLEYVARYGFEKPRGRWCYTEFKYKPLVRFERRLPKPVLEVDGMSPSDSTARARAVSAELEEIRSEQRHYWSWHPLFSLRMSGRERLETLRRHPEFAPVVRLYDVYGDSLNCAVCPYKSRAKLTSLATAEPGDVYAAALELSLRSQRWRERLAALKQTTTILDYA